jgi:predicted enzyme related to lactoylglutathione lyase
MITGVHAIVYAERAEATRAFLRDVLGLSSVDAGHGWLIFALPPAELGVHPTGEGALPSGGHELYLTCDDVEATVAELAGKGVEFTSGITDAGFGRLISMKVPGGGTLGLYQPRHATAFDLPGDDR